MYTLYGAIGSPYSVKMRAVLRYRRISHVWRTGPEAFHTSTTKVRAPVIPVLEFPDGRYANDSTPLIDELERRHSERSIIPPDPADAFLAFLIEDFADEWLTKAMFQYRWRRERDQTQMKRWLAFDFLKGGGASNLEAMGADFAARQVGRLPLVGCSPDNYDLIEDTATELMAALETHVQDRFYIFGDRPSRAEFALFGQILQLTTDPTPQALMLDRFPYLYRWVMNVDDLSGVDGRWQEVAGTGEPPLLTALLSLIGEVYLPFLVANAEAVANKAEIVSLELRGKVYHQAPFKYQVKCLAALRERYAALSAVTTAKLAPLLSKAGALRMLRG